VKKVGADLLPEACLDHVVGAWQGPARPQAAVEHDATEQRRNAQHQECNSD